jgi:hypothetical protein
LELVGGSAAGEFALGADEMGGGAAGSANLISAGAVAQARQVRMNDNSFIMDGGGD